jgi:sugar phosphate permease
MSEGATTAVAAAALDRARQKAYRRLLPLCFISYVIAYVDRSNVAIAKLTMTRDLPGFDNAVIGHGLRRETPWGTSAASWGRSCSGRWRR